MRKIKIQSVKVHRETYGNKEADKSTKFSTSLEFKKYLGVVPKHRIKFLLNQRLIGK